MPRRIEHERTTTSAPTIIATVRFRSERQAPPRLPRLRAIRCPRMCIAWFIAPMDRGEQSACHGRFFVRNRRSPAKSSGTPARDPLAGNYCPRWKDLHGTAPPALSTSLSSSHCRHWRRPLPHFNAALRVAALRVEGHERASPRCREHDGCGTVEGDRDELSASCRQALLIAYIR